MPELVILPIFAICITYMIVSIARVFLRMRREARMEDLTRKLIDKLGTGAEVAAFLASDAYKKLLDSEPTPESGLQNRILNSIQGGAVLLANGLALMFTNRWLTENHVRTFGAVAGSVLVAVGFALLLSAAASYWLMTKWRTERG